MTFTCPTKETSALTKPFTIHKLQGDKYFVTVTNGTGLSYCTSYIFIHMKINRMVVWLYSNTEWAIYTWTFTLKFAGQLFGNFAGLPSCTVPSASVHCSQNEAGHHTIKSPSLPCWGTAGKHYLTFIPEDWWNWQLNGWNLHLWEIIRTRARGMDIFLHTRE